MTRPRSRPSCFVILLILAGVLSGCATAQHLGIRPDEPAIKASADACTEYEGYSTYAQQLEEAYHSRATQNRGWIYVAGILGLAVAAASGGLAVASAVGAGTLGLLAISGGFAAGSFATINNSDLALSYTAAANSVDQALKDARHQLTFEADGKSYTRTSCAAALPVLSAGVSDARTHLEVSRTNNAAGALARAKDQQKMLNDLIAGVEAGNPTQVTLSADITKVDPPQQKDMGQPTPVTLTIKNIRLDQVAQSDVHVLLGSRVLSLEGPAQAGADNTYTVKFIAPPDPPDPPTKSYAPFLLVGKAKQRVGSLRGEKFTYK